MAEVQEETAHPWRKVVLYASLATVLYLAVAVLLMRPAITNCSTTIMGHGGDSTAGGVWSSWNYQKLDASPFTTETPLVGAPGKGVLWRPLLVTSLEWRLPVWSLTHLVGPVCSWNIAILAAFLLDGLAMFGLAYWLTRRPLVALAAGYAYAFTPFHIVKSYGHIAYIHTWAFPLLVWAVLALSRRPNARRAVLVAAALAIAFYTDGYYILLASVTAVVLAVASLAGSWRAREVFVARLRGLLLAAGLAFVFVLPVTLTFVGAKGSIDASVTRSVGELDTYGARVTEYVLPAQSHPVFQKYTKDYQDRHLHGSNYSEQSLYLGWTVLLPAVGAAILGFRRRIFEARWLIALAVVAFVFSLPRHVGPIPTPLQLLFHVTPYWRVAGRFFIVVDTAVVTLAAIGLAWAARGRWRTIVPLAALPLIAFDLLATSPLPSFSYADDSPEAYHWLADVPGDPIVAEYPLLPEPSSAMLTYLTYQPLHEKRLFNGAPQGSPRAELERSLFALDDPQTVPSLRALGVAYVVIHTDFFDPRLTTVTVPGLEEVHSSGSMRVLRLLDGERAQQALTIGDGFGPNEATGLSGGRWMGDKGTLHVWHFDGGGAGEVEAGFTAGSFGRPRTVTVVQRSRVLWSGTVDQSTPVRFVADGRGPIEVRTDPGSQRIGDVTGTDDDRRVSLYVTGLWTGTKR